MHRISPIPFGSFVLKEELQATREKLAAASEEVQSLRQYKDQLEAGWEESRRLRACLDGTKRLGSEMAVKVEAAEARAERARYAANSNWR